MQIYKFDCNGHNAPAYGCNKPGDNSGEYVKVDDLANMLRSGIADLNDGGEPIAEEAAMIDVMRDLLAEVGAA